jgi:isopenicillin-N N-acyltransferase-like protein
MVNECSTVVSTAPGRAPLAAQTWDWYPAMRDNWMVWTFETEAGRRITTLTEYGVLAKIGVNDAGLGVMLNMLHHDADDQTGHDPRVGFPVHVMLRTLLEQCSSVAEARDLVTAEPFSASSALPVVDRDGDAVSFEVFPAGVGEVKPEAGLLVRTNHFVSAEGEPGCQAGLVDDNSWVRRDHLVAGLSAETPGSAADIHRAMTHHDVAGPVCRHAAHPDSPELVETATLATVALDVAHGTLAAQRGGPCGRD